MDKDPESTELPGQSKKASRAADDPRNKIRAEHTTLTIDYIDKNPTAVVDDVTNDLCAKFDGLSITSSAVEKHMKTHCSLSLKRVHPQVQARNAERTIFMRQDAVQLWIKNGVDFMTNCVFIDEAGFNLHLVRLYAWSKKGKPAKVEVPNNAGINLSILRCISAEGIIHISKRDPKPSKKRRRNETSTASGPGATSEHFLEYLEDMMDTLDEHGMQGRYLVLDNARIHHTQKVQNLVSARGYHLLFLPPYSPFLNPIEECWSKLKANVRRGPVKTSRDQLSARIREAANKITQQDCRNWVLHAQSYWQRCLSMEDL